MKNYLHRQNIFFQLNCTIIVISFIFFFVIKGQAQKLRLFGNNDRIELVKKGRNYIYNMQPDSANIIIKQVRNTLPNHPIVPMMEALNIAWQEMPLHSTSKVYDSHIDALDKVIKASEQLQQEQEYHPEGIFFEISARGLKSEYYVQEKNYIKALKEARKIYDLYKKGFELVNEYSEFLFLIGLYNYFREKYPQRYPILKPFMWIFKSGDIEKGLQQVDSATKVGILTKIESHLYISYIYLRYENNTVKAKKYLSNLIKEYPNNLYFQSKLIEYYATQKESEKALPYIITLLLNKDNYYKMCGEVFYGVYFEKEKKDLEKAILYYKKSLKSGLHYTLKGLYFKSLAYIGLGRIHAIRGNKIVAKEYFKKAIEIDESELVTKEAKKKLKNLK